VGAADDIVILCRRATADSRFGLCEEHRLQVLAARRSIRRAC
jgi:hypothetical protein